MSEYPKWVGERGKPERRLVHSLEEEMRYVNDSARPKGKPIETTINPAFVRTIVGPPLEPAKPTAAKKAKK